MTHDLENAPVFVEMACPFCQITTRQLVASNAYDVVPDMALRYLGPNVRLHPVHTCTRCGDSWLDADYLDD